MVHISNVGREYVYSLHTDFRNIFHLTDKESTVDFHPKRFHHGYFNYDNIHKDNKKYTINQSLMSYNFGV